MRRLVAAVAGPAGLGLRVVVRAAPGLVGLGLVSYGAWAVYRPAGFIVAGLLVLADRVVESLAERPRGRREGE